MKVALVSEDSIGVGRSPIEYSDDFKKYVCPGQTPDEHMVELFADHAALCICQPEEVRFKPLASIECIHWWMRPWYAWLDENELIVSFVKQCALCGTVVEEPNTEYADDLEDMGLSTWNPENR